MALYSLHTSAISRKAGRSAVAAAAYRAGVELIDERSGVVHDYTRKAGVEHVELFAPDGIQLDDPSALWNAAEAAEKRKDGRTAREILVALPAELNADQRTELAQAITRDLVDRYGVAAQLAIHAPDRDGDQRNHHAHILITTRRYNHDGIGAKAQLEWSNTQLKEAGLPKAADELKAMRARYGAMQNTALGRANVAARVDHRSLADQGIDRVPQVHVGNYGTQMIRRGTPERSERALLNLEIIDTNREVQHLREQLDAERAVEEWAEITPATPRSTALELPEPVASPAADAELTQALQSARLDALERIEHHIAGRHQLQIRASLRALERAQQRRWERIEEREWEEWISRPDVCSATGRIITELHVNAVIEQERALPENQPPTQPPRPGSTISRLAAEARVSEPRVQIQGAVQETTAMQDRRARLAAGREERQARELSDAEIADLRQAADVAGRVMDAELGAQEPPQVPSLSSPSPQERAATEARRVLRMPDQGEREAAIREAMCDPDDCYADEFAEQMLELGIGSLGELSPEAQRAQIPSALRAAMGEGEQEGGRQANQPHHRHPRGPSNNGPGFG